MRLVRMHALLDTGIYQTKMAVRSLWVVCSFGKQRFQWFSQVRHKGFSLHAQSL